MQSCNGLDMGIRVKLLTSYISKKDKKEHISKEPYKTIDTETRYCREECLRDFTGVLEEERVRESPNGNALSPYIFSTFPYIVIDGIEYMGEAAIRLNYFHDIKVRKQFSSEKVVEDYINLLHIYLGLTDTILYDSKERRTQKKKLKYVTDSVSFIDDIEYGCCSCEFVNNPYTVSLYLGIARDCINLIMDYTTNVLKMVNIDEVKDVINKGNKTRAKELLFEIALPYLSSEEVKGAGDDYYYGEDDEDDDKWVEDGIEGSPSCNILTNPTILRNFKKLLNKEYKFSNSNIYKEWEIVLDSDEGIGICSMEECIYER